MDFATSRSELIYYDELDQCCGHIMCDETADVANLKQLPILWSKAHLKHAS